MAEPIKRKDNDIALIGKVAQFPKNTKITKAYTYLENIKIPKNKIWYLIVEQQDTEIQLIKYNRVEGVDIDVMVKELKHYYIKHYADNADIIKAVEGLEVVAEDKYAIIRNIGK